MRRSQSTIVSIFFACIVIWAAVPNWKPFPKARAAEPVKITDSATAGLVVTKTNSHTELTAPNKSLLPNAHWIHSHVISGGQPQGTAAFELLRQMGIRTVISVDGIRPEVDLARQHDLRYVHLPFGYDGIPEVRVQELAHAFLTLPGPLYVHCHHGKHRSPAAAAAAGVTAGLTDQKQALHFLRKAGTSPIYKGLWASVDNARPADTAKLTSLEVRFCESVDPPPLVDTMTQLESTIEQLETLSRRQWDENATSVSLSAPHQALLLREHFTEFARLPTTEDQPQEFRTLVTESRNQAVLLETLLTTPSPATSDEPARLTTILGTIRNRCRECHRRFRD